MTPLIRFAAVAAVIGILVAVVGVMPRTVGPSGQNFTSPTPTSAASRSVATGPTSGPIDTSTWTSYTSDRYGFSIGHPADWSEQPADHTWTMSDATAIPYSSGAEHFLSPEGEVGVSAWSVAVDPGSGDQWVYAYCQRATAPCDSLFDRVIAVTVDGHPGGLHRFAQDTQAFIQSGDRMYVVAVWRPDSDPAAAPYGGAIRLLQGFISTMHLLPGRTVLDTSSWKTYFSDRYGFSIGHPADWSEQPADHTWTMADATAIPYSSATEHFLSPDGEVGVSAWSVAIDPGTTADAWIQSYCQLLENDSPCVDLEPLTIPVTMEGQPGSLVKFAQDTQAFIVVGDRMYVVAIWRPDADPSTASYGGSVGLLEAYLSTMHLLGGDAVHVGSLKPGNYTDFAVDQGGMNVAFIVPAGWSWDGRALTKSAGNRSVAASISFYAGPVDVYADPCHWSGASSATSNHQASVNAVMNALGAQQARDASQPVDRSADALTFAGRWAGKAVNLTLPAELDLSTCDLGQFRSWGPDARVRVNDGAGEHDLVWAVDLQGNGVSVPGEMLIIDAGAFPDTPPDVLAEVDSILASVRTGHWG